MRVLNVITGLPIGGTERILAQLSVRLASRGHSVRVTALGTWGPTGDILERGGVEVTALGMRRSNPLPRGALGFFRMLQTWRPDIVQTWLYHADLYGGLMAKAAGLRHVVWNIRHSNLDPGRNKWHTLMAARMCARASRWVPERIVTNSRAAAELHQAIGYVAEKFQVIPNGFDTEIFKPDEDARTWLRKELKLRQDSPVVGFIARFNAQKDHQTFIRAAGLMAERDSTVRFLLCGEDMTWENVVLAGWIRETGYAERFLLLGRRTDIARVTAALDVAASSSVGESFSNVIGEAMACGVPCVVTDVGDAAQIVGDTGRVVPPQRPEALAHAWGEMLAIPLEARGVLGARARQRIVALYSVNAMVDAYEGLYRHLVEGAEA